jgi:hypothetical protein
LLGSQDEKKKHKNCYEDDFLPRQNTKEIKKNFPGEYEFYRISMHVKYFSNNRLIEKDGDFWIMKYKQLVVDVMQIPRHII